MDEDHQGINGGPPRSRGVAGTGRHTLRLANLISFAERAESFSCRRIGAQRVVEQESKAESKPEEKHACKGRNVCKGKGGCKKPRRRVIARHKGTSCREGRLPDQTKKERTVTG